MVPDVEKLEEAFSVQDEAGLCFKSPGEISRISTQERKKTLKCLNFEQRRALVFGSNSDDR